MCHGLIDRVDERAVEREDTAFGRKDSIQSSAEEHQISPPFLKIVVNSILA
jgi:hypothetical protein